MRNRIPGLRLGKGEAAAPILIPHLVELIAPDLTAEPEGVLASGNGSVVEKLKRVVLVLKGAIGAVANPVVVSDADAGNSPGDGLAALQAGNAKLIHHIALVREQR